MFADKYLYLSNPVVTVNKHIHALLITRTKWIVNHVCIIMAPNPNGFKQVIDT